MDGININGHADGYEQVNEEGHGILKAPSVPTVSDAQSPVGIEHVSASQFASSGTSFSRMDFEDEKARLRREEAQTQTQVGNAPGAPEVSFVSPGMMPPEVYERTMVWWRAALRKAIMSNLETESRWLATMQARVRTPWLDTYFVYTSILGTHTFFMIGLPLCWFFGYGEVGFGLIFVLSAGVYVSSFLKDLICSPRPYSPPVTRLTVGTHHLEYGFPSTHSTNSVSIALYFFSIAHDSYNASTISQTTYYAYLALLALYTLSVVYGRLYTGMHSFTDCAMGVMLGAAIWGVHRLLTPAMLKWTFECGWIVPAVVMPITALIVNQHPQPADDCPCFEDAIAFVSVMAGIVMGSWHSARYGLSPASFTTLTPGSALSSPSDISLFTFYALLKISIGILIIFAWRIAAKAILHASLPPIFRLLAQGFTLPHRRFYTPATEYESMPIEKGLYPIPSVIDLPGQMQQAMREDSEASGRRRNGVGMGQFVKMRSRYAQLNGRAKLMRMPSYEAEKNDGDEEEDEADLKPGKGVKHYDADVLTKVIVYSGIAILASEFVPLMFDRLGWGVYMAAQTV